MDLLVPTTTIAAASVAGVSHLRAGVPCQDRYAVATIDGTVVIAVADGLGSAARAHDGADIAVRAAVEGDGDPLTRVEQARAALEAAGAPMRDLACTLSVTVWHADGANCAHIGDGAIVAGTADGPVLLSAPAPSEYVNETDPLTGDGWRERIRTASMDEQVHWIAAFTDGVQRAALRPDGAPSDGFFAPLIAWLGSSEATDAELAGLLGGRKLSEHSDDDKTLVLALRRP